MKIVAIIYGLVVLICLGWIASVFGLLYACPLSLLLGIPVFLYIPMTNRDRMPKRREYVYAGIATALVLTATPFLIHKWFNSFEYQLILFESDLGEFKQKIESEPRFSQVEVDHDVVFGGRIYLKGTVRSKADHDELMHLAEVASQHASSTCQDEVEIDTFDLD